MSTQLVQGELRIDRADLVRVLPCVKEYAQVSGDPRQKKSFYGNGEPVWAVEFTTTQEQWKKLEPQLRQMGVEINLWQMPDRYFQAQRDEQRYLKQIGQKSRHQLVYLLGAALLVGGAIYSMTGGGLVGWLIMGLGILVEVLGNTGIQKWINDRTHESREKRN